MKSIKIFKSEVKNIWFTSDLHFYHTNILKFNPRTRPFKNIDEMHETMIQEWNSKVSNDDIVYILGDVSFKITPESLKETVGKLNGKLHLIIGNHDKESDELYSYFQSVNSYSMLRVIGETKKDSVFISLFHFPIFEWERMDQGSYMLHGHSHGSVDNKINGRILDVGWDGKFGQSLVNFEVIKKYMENKPISKRYHKEWC